MIGVDDLIDLILAETEPLPANNRPIDLSIGCVLADDLVAVDPLPPFANSAMDGFAIRRDGREFAASYRIVDDLAAGSVAGARIAGGEAVRIATGAMLPVNADAVVPIELSSVIGHQVSFTGAIPSHGHVRPAGEDVPVGSVVARSGTLLTVPLVALAEGSGVTTCSVIRRPNVAIVTTGDELIGPRDALVPGAVRDVNGLLLSHAVTALGMMPQLFGRFSDDAERIVSELSATHMADAVVICGGLGPGRKDVVADALRRSGTARTFQVAMRPGKAFAFGRVAGKPVYAVPGNPGAALAAFHAVVAPALRVLAGRPPFPSPIQAVLTRPLANPGGRRHYVRATLAWDGPTLAATPTGRQGSGLVSDIVAADALLVIPEAVEHAASGDVVQILPLKPLGGP